MLVPVNHCPWQYVLGAGHGGPIDNPLGFPHGVVVKNPLANAGMQETQVWSLCQEDPFLPDNSMSFKRTYVNWENYPCYFASSWMYVLQAWTLA